MIERCLGPLVTIARTLFYLLCFTAGFIKELFMSWFVNNVGTYVVLLTAYALAIPMQLLPRGSSSRLLLAMLLEYLKSWLKPRVSNETIQKVNQAFTGHKSYQDLLPAEKVKFIRNYQRRKRLQESVRREVRKRRIKRECLAKTMAKLTTLIIGAYLTQQPAAAHGATPPAAAILTAMPTIMNATDAPTVPERM